MSSTNLKELIGALHDAILAVPAADRAYAVRYVSRNYGLGKPQMLAAWEKDRADREEAARIQRHREEVVLNEAAEIAKRHGAVVDLTGVAAAAGVALVDTKSE